MVWRTLGASADEEGSLTEEVLGDVGELLEGFRHCDGELIGREGKE